MKNQNTQFVNDCIAAEVNSVIKREKISFEELFNLNYPVQCTQDPSWTFFISDFEIYAVTKKDFEMRVWNRNHPVKDNITIHTCPCGTRVRIWAISRFGDLGITDNLKNPIGYDCRGVLVHELENYEFVRIRKTYMSNE